MSPVKPSAAQMYEKKITAPTTFSPLVVDSIPFSMMRSVVRMHRSLHYSWCIACRMEDLLTCLPSLEKLYPRPILWQADSVNVAMEEDTTTVLSWLASWLQKSRPTMHVADNDARPS